MKIALPDLISPSYFPAIAAVELGFFAEQGLDASIELIGPVEKSYQALAEGEVDFVAGSAHSTLSVFPEWDGASLICAQSQGMYWFLVMRSGLGATPGDLEVVKGRNIGAAPWPGMGLRRLLAESGIDLERDEVNIVTVPGSGARTNSVGVTAAKALEAGRIDGFWANGMGAEIAVLSGAGTIVYDARRDCRADAGFNYTLPSIATTERLISDMPEAAAAAVRAIGNTLIELKQNVGRAAEAAKRVFPDYESSLIVELVRRDLPFYESNITENFVAEMNRFARNTGILKADAAYDKVVAVEFRQLWTA